MDLLGPLTNIQMAFEGGWRGLGRGREAVKLEDINQ